MRDRLAQLYEISQLMASADDVEQSFYPVLEIAARTVALRSAILLKAEAGQPRIMIWPAPGAAEPPGAAVTWAEAAYAKLVAAPRSTAGPDLAPAPPASERVVVIPLVVADRSPLGVLQVEGAHPLQRTDLAFVHAIASQLAIAFDRDRARREDISRREHAEEGHEVAQHAVRVRDDLLAIVSHDLRSPLWTILMAADALTEGADGPATAERIRRAARRMMRLIEDLLDFASIEAGRLAMRRARQDAAALLAEVHTSFEATARKKGLTLTVAGAGPLPAIHGDGDRILQVFSNLVGNAIRATPEGGHIDLSGQVRAGEVLFSVVDDGPGIDPVNLPHLFERYWRGDDATYQGVGLGLAIARGIVSAHGGEIWADSTPGHGARFQFTIPTADVTDLFAVPSAADDHPHEAHP